MSSISMVQYLDKILKITLTMFVLWNAFNPLPALQEGSIFIMLLLLCLFVQRIAKGDMKRMKIIAFIAMIVGTIVSYGYVIIYYNEILYFSGIAPSYTTYLGILAIFVLVIGCRMAAGMSLMLVIVATIIYGAFGHILPREFGGHFYLSPDRLISSIYLSTDGIFGSVTYTMLKYVFLFVLFGKLLEKLGAISFVIDISLATLGKLRGGPAMVATLSSGLMGSVNGSAVSNVMVTGTLSIPMMKRVGFKPEYAGGVEAAASTGGQFTPPVLGATAFLIVSFLGVDYIEVVKATLIPATLFYISLITSIYIYSYKNNVGKLPADEIPGIKSALLNMNGITFITGIFILVFMLINGNSPIISVLYSCAGLIIVSFLGKSRITFKKSVDILKETSEDFLVMGVAGGAIGIMISILLLSGLVLRFSSLILSFAGSNIFLILLMTAVCSIVIGFGLPTSLTYIVLSIMAVPILIELGILPIAAHMFVFFVGIMAMVTPPVALAAMAAATIAKSDLWRTGFSAFKLTLPALVLPFFFVMENSLLMIGSPSEIIINSTYALIGVCVMSLSLTGDIVSKRDFIERTGFFLSSILLIFPSEISTICGILVFIVFSSRYIVNYFKSRKSIAIKE